MQTFLPFADYGESAKCLDRLRLGKQRCEAWQLLECICDLGCQGWSNHPAARMWRGHEIALAEYGRVITLEWISRGYNDTMHERFVEFLSFQSQDRFQGRPHVVASTPPWLGDPDFHRSHQSNLVRKLPGHYSKFFPRVPSDLPYVWPVA